MKKIIPFLLLVVFFMSCKRKHYNAEVSEIVGNVSNGICWYKVAQYWSANDLFCCTANIVDSCGTYKVGDSVNLDKYFK